jgi:hypothetical protein
MFTRYTPESITSDILALAKARLEADQYQNLTATIHAVIMEITIFYLIPEMVKANEEE